MILKPRQCQRSPSPIDAQAHPASYLDELIHFRDYNQLASVKSPDKDQKLQQKIYIL